MIAAVMMLLADPVICHPKEPTARVLKSAAPNDIHPDWAGKNVIGMGWGLIPDDVETDSFGIEYLHGNLVSPRGGVTKDVFAVRKEWDCGA